MHHFCMFIVCRYTYNPGTYHLCIKLLCVAVSYIIAVPEANTELVAQESRVTSGVVSRILRLFETWQRGR